MVFKDWNEFLKSKSASRLKEAVSQPKLLLSSMDSVRSQVWDVVIGE